MNINLTITLDQETKDLLQKLLNNLQVAPKVGTKITGPKEAEKPTMDNNPSPVEKPKVKESAHTIESIRAIAHNKTKEDVRALLTEFKVAGLTKLTPDQYDEFMVKLNQLS